MQEQVTVMKQLNSFLERRGLRANFLAQQVGISEASLGDPKIDEFLEELERDHGIRLKRLPVTSVIAV